MLQELQEKRAKCTRSSEAGGAVCYRLGRPGRLTDPPPLLRLGLGDAVGAGAGREGADTLGADTLGAENERDGADGSARNEGAGAGREGATIGALGAIGTAEGARPIAGEPGLTDWAL